MVEFWVPTAIYRHQIPNTVKYLLILLPKRLANYSSALVPDVSIATLITRAGYRIYRYHACIVARVVLAEFND